MPWGYEIWMIQFSMMVPRTGLISTILYHCFLPNSSKKTEFRTSASASFGPFQCPSVQGQGAGSTALWLPDSPGVTFKSEKVPGSPAFSMDCRRCEAGPRGPDEWPCFLEAMSGRQGRRPGCFPRNTGGPLGFQDWSSRLLGRLSMPLGSPLNVAATGSRTSRPRIVKGAVEKRKRQELPVPLGD